MKLSLLDKLSLFFDVAKDSIWSIIILIVLLVIVYVYLSTNKKTVKRNKKIFIGLSLLTLITLLICYLPSINKIFDNMINNLFIIIYFPNLAIYFAAIIATSIILWISLFNFKTTNIIKRLNLVLYLIINYLFALLLYVINDKNLNIFNQKSIYGNKQATALIELTSIIFVIWILFLIIYKIILIYLRKDYKPKVKKIIIKKEVKHLPDNYLNIKAPKIVYTDKPRLKEDKLYIEKEVPKVVYGTIPKKYEFNKKIIKMYDDILSIEDYKLLLKLLKEKQKESNEEVKEANLTELDNLYRSIR